MAITNFDFPSVTFRQNFAPTVTSTDRQLNVTCIGVQYKVHAYDTEAATELGKFSVVGGQEVKLTSEQFAVDSDWYSNDPTAALVVDKGIFSYCELSCNLDSTNGQYEITCPEVVKSGNNHSVDPEHFGVRGVNVGDTVILSDTNDVIVTTYITDIESSTDASGYNKIIVASITNDANQLLADGPVTVKFCDVATIEAEAVTVTYASNPGAHSLTVTVPGTITTTTLPGLSGITGTLEESDIYFNYREVRSDYIGQRGSVGSYDEIVEIFGAINNNNPLALACWMALSAGNNTTVYFTGVAADTAENYREAMGYLERFNDMYSVVPCTESESVIKACMDECVRVSSGEDSKIRRALWYGITLKDEVYKYTGSFTPAVLDNVTNIVVNTHNYNKGEAGASYQAWNATPLPSTKEVYSTLSTLGGSYARRGPVAGTGEYAEEYAIAWYGESEVLYSHDDDIAVDTGLWRNINDAISASGTANVTVTAVGSTETVYEYPAIVYTASAAVGVGDIAYSDTDLEYNAGAITAVSGAETAAAYCTVLGTEALPTYRGSDVVVIDDTGSRLSVASIDSSNRRITFVTGTVVTESTRTAFTYIPKAPTKTELINKVIKRRWTNSERGVAVWADTALYNGEEIDNYALAAAAAGMRAYEPCQRPLSNLKYTAFSLREPNGFTTAQLKEIGKNGIWIIANNDDGTPINKRQVTTAASDNLNLTEESIVANADTIAMDLCRLGEDLVGCSNISPELLSSLEDMLTTKMNTYLVNDTGNVYIGPQLLAWELTALYQHAVNLDHIYAAFDITPPKPFNKFHMVMQVI